MANSIEVKNIEVNGKNVSYRQAGAGQPVLYLHGFPTSGYLWRKVMREVSQGFMTIAPDLPGFGDSDLMEGHHGWRELKDWIDAFVDALGIAPVHLSVHDWGGLIGMPWFCEHPGKVRSLLISDTSFSSRDRWHALATEWRKPEVGEELLGSMTREGFGSMLAVTVSKPLDEDSAAEYFKCVATPERRAAKLQMYRSLDFPMFEPYMDEFPKIAMGKSRIIWGGADMFVPLKTAHRLSDLLSAELTVLEQANHFLQEDAGEELGKLHREFLRSLA
jgi:haloalkane dehalogenase